MKIINYICLMLTLLFAAPAWAQFDPTNPPEPEWPTATYRFNYTVVPQGAGYVNVYGSPCAEGGTVRANAYTYSNYRFLRWETLEGEEYSSSPNVTVTMPAADVHLVAVYEFVPTSPGEPEVPGNKRTLRTSVRPAAAGYTYHNGESFNVGQTISISFSQSSNNYTFQNWARNGEVISTKRQFDYTIIDGDNTLVANFKYTPQSPAEPESPGKRLDCSVYPAGAGYTNLSASQQLVPGQSYYVSAQANNDYTFKNWTDDTGQVVSTTSAFTYTMPDRNARLRANFTFMPYSPDEPGAPEVQRNAIYGMRQTVKPASQVYYAVSVQNVDQLTGISVDITVPEGCTADFASAVLAPRASEGHTVSAEEVSAGTWRLSVRGNSTLEGANGAVVLVPFTVSPYVEPGVSIIIPMAKGVAYLADGNQSAITASDGILKIADEEITLPDSADFVVSQVSADNADIMPGQPVTFNWTVTNQGTVASTGGWNETLSLVDENGNTSTLATMFFESEGIEPGASVSRTATVLVPDLPGVDGRLNPRVTLRPAAASGEIPEFQGNNTTIGEGWPITLGKYLQIEMKPSLQEGTDVSVLCRLNRSGSWRSAQNFSITVSPTDTRVKVPATVTIPRAQSGAYFSITVEDNAELDENLEYTITASGNGYEDISTGFEVVDNELPMLTLTAEPDEMQEGGKSTMTVTTQRAPQADLTVTITCETAKKFSFPSTVIIPVGSTSASFEVASINDDVPDMDHEYNFSAVAPGHTPASESILVTDDDVPSLQMTLMPETVAENAGPMAVTATITRTSNIDKEVTIEFSDDSRGQLFYPARRMVIPAGQKEANFNFGPLDNAMVDGERTVQFSAAVYIASCGCSATKPSSGGIVTLPLTITDDDGPALSLTSGASVVREGGELHITVTRNTDATSPLIVLLASDQADVLEFPATVTIPVGSRSATFTVKALRNDIAGDSATASIMATADGYSRGSLWFTVSDQSIPDARISGLKRVDDDDIKAGGQVTLVATLVNDGFATLPELTEVNFYVSGDSRLAATGYLQQELAPGATAEVSKAVTLPARTGESTLYAIVNESRKAAEISYTNNTSPTLAVTTVSPYITQVSVDKAIASPGETVKINGHVDGLANAGQDVEVYVLNRGYRHAATLVTDANGDFEYDYTPYVGQTGHFSVGACFPGERLEKEQAAFDIYGMHAYLPSDRTYELTVGDPKEDFFELENDGVLPLSGITAKLVAKPANFDIVLSVPTDIEADGSVKVSYTITPNAPSTGNDWERAQIEITSAQGATETVTLYCYARLRQGRLEPSVARINTTMSLGVPREYPFTVKNTGAGETGKISLALPSWMQSVTPSEIASLASGEEANIVIRFIPTPQMQLNVPVSGTIGINAENAAGISLPYSVEPVSETLGTLVVDATDQYTYFTTEAPHVADATVTLSHPVTGAVVIQGKTNADGLFPMEVPEGYYRLSVTADHHSQWTDNILVSPGDNGTMTVALDYTAITYTFNVEETEVEDNYTVTTTVKYETNVPRPVVIMEGPERIDGDNMAIGETQIVYLSITNKGLMTAYENRVRKPQDTDEWEFRLLDYTEPFDLLAGQAVVVPMAVTRISINGEVPEDAPRHVRRRAASGSGTNLVENFRDCMAVANTTYKVLCNKNSLKEDIALTKMALKLCALSATGTTIFSYLSQFVSPAGWHPSPGSSLGGGYDIKNPKPDDSKKIETGKTINLCDPCESLKATLLFNLIINEHPVLGPVNEALDKIADYVLSPPDPIEMRLKLMMSNYKGLCQEMVKANPKALVQAMSHYKVDEAIDEGAGYFDKLIEIVKVLSIECPETVGNGAGKKETSAKTPTRDWLVTLNEAGEKFAEYITNVNEMMLAILGDMNWMDGDLDQKIHFFEAVENNPKITDEEAMAIKPDDISRDQLLTFMERMRNFATGVTGVENTVDLDLVNAKIDAAREINAEAITDGYISITDRFMQAYTTARNKFDQMVNDEVCASISLRLEQTMTMTRQAFRGTLTVFNGHEEKAMTDVKLHLTVKDEDGNVTTSHEFQISPENLDGFGGELDFNAGWTLGAKETGVSTILFIPTRYAAPDHDRYYTFGGTFSYIDPFTDLEVTRTLSPVTLTVRPAPTLDLTYFMQRDVLGDDPFTEAIEPSVDAEFSLLINNKGYGDATNVNMVTNQPEIIDNEKGLLINFELISSQLKGKDKTLALGKSVTTEFGDIPARSTTYAQWMLRSSLLGHFTDYDVEATHVSSYGNPDLTLLDNVTIHELIRSLETGDGDDRLVGFMTNDISDSEDFPDMLYWSDGTTENVFATRSASISYSSANVYTLTVDPLMSGWNYGNIEDPTSGRATLVSVTRDDGVQLSLRNFWQTDRTLRDGLKPLSEHRLHFADGFDTASPHSYTLVFQPRPEVELEVVSITGVPEDGKVTFDPVENVEVTFSKKIMPDTFTWEDLTYVWQGDKVSAAPVRFSTDDLQTYRLDLTGAGTSANGYYTLTVQTAGITDEEGFNGRVGKLAGWTLVNGGLVKVETKVQPEKSGDVEITTGDESGPNRVRVMKTADEPATVDYGTALLLTPVAEEGYEFVGWDRDGEEISRDVPLRLLASDDIDVTARFAKKTYTLTVVSDPVQGSVAGAASGVYEHGDVVTLTPEPTEDYAFRSWTVDDAEITGENLSLTMTADKTVEANFRLANLEHRIMMQKGWNWISSYLAFENNVDNFNFYFSDLRNHMDTPSVLSGDCSYHAKVPGLSVLVLKGAIPDGEPKADVEPGHNWISYPLQDEHSINAITNPNEGDVLIGQFGFSEYSDGGWHGTLQSMKPGEGYVYATGSNRTLLFDGNNAGGGVTLAETVDPSVSVGNADPYAYPYAMPVIARVKNGGTSVADSAVESMETYAMCGTAVRGNGAVLDGRHYLQVYGEMGDQISFILRDPSTGASYLANETMPLSEALVGSHAEPFTLTIDTTTGVQNPGTDGRIRVYTVLGVLIDDNATIETLQRLEPGVYVINGRKYIVR